MIIHVALIPRLFKSTSFWITEDDKFLVSQDQVVRRRKRFVIRTTRDFSFTTITSGDIAKKGAYELSGLEWTVEWTGLEWTVDWTTGLEWTVDWTGALDYWNGSMYYWTGCACAYDSIALQYYVRALANKEHWRFSASMRNEMIRRE